MTTYKEVKGTNIEAVASDPSNPLEGQIWFNTATYLVKAFFVNPGSWATGGDLGTARYGVGGSGTQTAAVAFGGSPSTGKTELYNGTGWTEVNDLNSAGHFFGSAQGTQTATIAFGGQGSRPSGNGVDAEVWNGTSWSEVGNMSVARGLQRGAGTQAAAIAAGGAGPGSDEADASESFSSGPATATLGSE